MMNKSLVKNAAFNILYRTVNVLFPLISAAYISRILTPEGIGEIAYSQNIVSYFLMIAALGIPQYGTREMARKRNDPQEAGKLFGELMTINFLSTTICMLVYTWCIGRLFFGNVLMGMVFGLELGFNYINIDWLYQGREDYTYIVIRSILIKALSLLMMFLFVTKPQDGVAYALILCMGTGCNYIYNIVHARKVIRPVFRGLELGRHFRALLILTFSSAMASLYSKVDMTMLGWLSGNEAVGYYSNSQKIISTVLTMVTAISAVFLPRLSYLYENKREELGRYITLGTKIVILAAVPSCVGLILVADTLVAVLYGPAFAPAASVVKILSVLILIRGIGDLLCYQLVICSGNEKKLISSRMVASVANIVLNSILIPKFAQDGAAAASVVSELIVNGMMLRYALRIERPAVDRRFISSTVISAAVMVLAVLAVRSVVYGAGLCLLLSVSVGVLVYITSILLTKNELAALAVRTIRKRRHKEISS